MTYYPYPAQVRPYECYRRNSKLQVVLGAVTYICHNAVHLLMCRYSLLGNQNGMVWYMFIISSKAQALTVGGFQSCANGNLKKDGTKLTIL